MYYGGFRNRCPTGEAVISHGHNLSQPWIIHLVGPYLDDAGKVQVELYCKTIRSVLACIDGVKIRSVSYAVFGTGYYGCPRLLAVRAVVWVAGGVLTESLRLSRACKQAVMTLRVIRDWLSRPENQAKCDKITLCTSYGGGDMLKALLPLAFPVAA